MNVMRNLRTWTAVAMLAAFSVTLLAPAAEAGRRRYKHRDERSNGGWVERAPRRVVHVRKHSSDASTVIGFLGGIAVGALLAKAAEPRAAYAEPDYSYEDPYCGRRYRSLQGYQGHLRGCDHPRVVRVIEVSSGECVDTRRWESGGRWVDVDERDWDQGYDESRDRNWEYEE